MLLLLLLHSVASTFIAYGRPKVHSSAAVPLALVRAAEGTLPTIREYLVDIFWCLLLKVHRAKASCCFCLGSVIIITLISIKISFRFEFESDQRDGVYNVYICICTRYIFTLYILAAVIYCCCTYSSQSQGVLLIFEFRICDKRHLDVAGK